MMELYLRICDRAKICPDSYGFHVPPPEAAAAIMARLKQFKSGRGYTVPMIERAIVEYRNGAKARSLRSIPSGLVLTRSGYVRPELMRPT